MPRQKSRTTPPPPPKKEHQIWWQRLTTGERVLTILTIVGILVAILAIPEVEIFLGLKKPPHEQTVQPPVVPGEENQPPVKSTPDEPVPVKPKIKYVPLPNAEPLARPKNLVTSNPNETKPETVAVHGEQVPVMTQADLDKYLEHKGQAFFKVNPHSGKVDLLVQVGKDGSVDNVQWVSGDKEVGEEAKEAIRQWKFKPFTKNGEQVGVEAVIHFSPKISVQYAQEPSHKDDKP